MDGLCNEQSQSDPDAVATTEDGGGDEVWMLNHDEQWLQQGRRLYSEASLTLQKTLHPRPYYDETLASARASLVYEFLELTSENPNAWETPRLLEVREEPQSAIAEAVFSNVRFPLMCKPLKLREKSSFSDKGWLMEAESQQVSNYGFQTAAMMADSERGVDVREDYIKLYR